MIEVNKKMISEIFADNSVEEYKKDLKNNIFKELGKSNKNVNYDFIRENLDELLSVNDDNN